MLAHLHLLRSLPRLTHLLPVRMPQITPLGSPVCPQHPDLKFTAPNLLCEDVCGAQHSQLLLPMSCPNLLAREAMRTQTARIWV